MTFRERVIFRYVFDANRAVGMVPYLLPSRWWPTAAVMEQQGWLGGKIAVSAAPGAKGYVVTGRGIDAYNTSLPQ